jgi:hypothetical protein
MELAKLKAFRQAVYNRLGAARDATFELTDAVLLTRNAYSLADLSLSPVFRRKWPSIYEALQDSRPQRNKLMKLYIEQMPSSGRPLIAVDHTCWQRPEAITLQERTIEHSCTAVPGNRPIALGQGYSTIAWIPEASGSWALPLRHERITSWENPIDKGAWQLRQVCRNLAVRPISLWDCEYGCAPFVLKTADIAADKLVRLRSNLCLWGAPPPYSGKGRPRIHGDKFQLNDPQTWGEASESLEVNDPKLGRMHIRLWRDLHFRGWSDLMPLLTWELWLAREIVCDNPLPWHNKSDKLAPGRVAQAFAGVLLAIDTPASPPKPRGKSSGWPKGKPRASRSRYPIVKKGSTRGKKRRRKLA